MIVLDNSELKNVNGGSNIFTAAFFNAAARSLSTIYRFDDEVFKKLISKVIMGDYEEDGSYNPNVVKFVLNLKNISSEGNTKFLSLEVDERIF